MRELLTNEQRGLPPSSRGAEKESATPFKRPTKKSPDAPSAKAKNSMSVLRMDPISIRGVMRMDPIEITPSPQRSEELYQILDFLTGRAQMASHPTDPPADVPTNVTQRTRYHSPGFPSRQVPGYQETSIKRWIYDAARYNNVPVVLMAVILQQENAPEVTDLTKQLQSGERRLQTLSAVNDERFWDIIPDKLPGGSTGIANLARATLRDAASYIERQYHKPVIPDPIKKDKGDPRIAGVDEQLDLYYMSARLRQIIDRRVSPGSLGNLSDEELVAVAKDYNGSGPKAVKYSKDALARLNAARQGTKPLLFLGEPPRNPSLLLQISIARGLGF